ncbi:MAG: hypothetical protein ACOYNC_15910 [Bacteroidales bacterium]
MKVYKMNRQKILSRLLWLGLFVALGCSQRSCSCKRIENIRQEIVITDRLGDKPSGKFPADFLNLLFMTSLDFVQGTDTLTQYFKPGVTLLRLDAPKKVGDVNQLGKSWWNKFTTNIFNFSPSEEKYNADIEKRFLTNTIGTELAAKSLMTDSLKIKELNKYILKEMQNTRRSRIYFFSSNPANNTYTCKIDLNDTTRSVKPGSSGTAKPAKKKGRGMGCSNLETAGNKSKEGRTKVDTVFHIFHSIDSINLLIAKQADSVIVNGSGCSMKDQTVKYIIVYEPPFVLRDTAIRILNIPDADTICNSATQKSFKRLITNVPSDSICWKVVKPCPGIKFESINGKGDSLCLKMKRQSPTASGEVVIKITPYKESVASIPAQIRFRISNCMYSVRPCRFILKTSAVFLKFNKENRCTTFIQPLSTIPGTTDSVSWELLKSTDGITVNMPGKKLRGKKEIPAFEVVKSPDIQRGTITFRITPWSAACKPPPYSSSLFIYQFSEYCSTCIKCDSAVLNPARRQIIDDVRELLFMIANTSTPKEKGFFKASALNKLKEIPGFQVVIVPSNTINAFLDDISSLQSGWTMPRISPIPDKNRCLIGGIRIEP